jgi:L-rhamnose isomerase
MIKSLLAAMLEPVEQLKRFEFEGDYTSRLALMEELKSMPFGAVWDYYCLIAGVPIGMDWLKEVKQYELEVQSNRGEKSENLIKPRLDPANQPRTITTNGMIS